MSLDSEKMKALVTFKKKLEKRLEDLDAETKEITAMLETVNQILLEKGFKRGDIKEVPQPSGDVPAVVIAKDKVRISPTQEPESVIPLKTLNEEPLAIIYVEKNSLHVLPDESKSFSVNTPPFNHFLVERILTRMQEKDSELVRMGQLTTDKMFAYNIVREGEFIREIIIKNVDEERLKELKSSLRWTFEKMYEKMKS
jgi:acetylornithine deacetylase/succinyl-diaminopimelate desuccinylase-like protein